MYVRSWASCFKLFQSVQKACRAFRYQIRMTSCLKLPNCQLKLVSIILQSMFDRSALGVSNTSKNVWFQKISIPPTDGMRPKSWTWKLLWDLKCCQPSLRTIFTNISLKKKTRLPSEIAIETNKFSFETHTKTALVTICKPNNLFLHQKKTCQIFSFYQIDCISN